MARILQRPRHHFTTRQTALWCRWPGILKFSPIALAPKIDEVRVAIVCMTETWLIEHHDGNIVNIAGYNIIRRDRVDVQHGGVCIYVKDSINYKILYDLMVSKFEVLWIQIRPKRLPRGLTSIIVGTVYHPLSADVSPMLEFLYTSLSSIEAGFPCCGVILLGDFNKALMQKTPSLCNAFNFHQIVNFHEIVNFPTRGDKTLDPIITNLKGFYAPPIKRPPFSLSDHASVQPLDRTKPPKVKVFVKTRGLCQTKRLAIRSYLEQVDVKALVDSKSACKGKVEILESIVKAGMDNILPPKSKSIFSRKCVTIKTINSIICSRHPINVKLT